MCLHAGLEPRYYDLLPERNWEVDVAQLDSLADEDTVALLICNPGNPCGQVFSEVHLREVSGNFPLGSICIGTERRADPLS